MEYRIDDKQLDAGKFIEFVNKVWPGKYDEGRTAEALSRTLNITAYDGETLVGCLRILTDGYFSVRLLKCWCCRNIKNRESEAGCFSWLRKIPRRCCISERSRQRRNSMRRMDARRAFNPT